MQLVQVELLVLLEHQVVLAVLEVLAILLLRRSFNVWLN